MEDKALCRGCVWLSSGDKADDLAPFYWDRRRVRIGWYRANGLSYYARSFDAFFIGILNGQLNGYFYERSSRRLKHGSSSDFD